VTAARRLRAEDGQYLPFFGAVLLALVVLAFTLFQVGAASALKSRAQTAADAAALAGEVEVKNEILAAGFEGLPPTGINQPAVCAQAALYAGYNGATLTSCTLELYDVKVVVRGTNGEPDDLAGRRGARARARARASLGVQYAQGLGGLPGGGAGPLSSTPGGNCVSGKDLAAVQEQAGVKIRGDSALHRYCGDGQSSGVDVADLRPAMQVAILRAEAELGHGLSLNSGFRSVAYQRVLCARVSGPCAPPGQSMHNFGMAVDVADYGELAGVAAKVGLCQPLPNNDAVHFSLAGDVECGGRAGAGGGGGLGGAGFGIAVYIPKLVAWEGGDFSLPSLTGTAPGNVAANLARIAQCESGGNPRIVSPDGVHRGKYQFDIPTWQSVGGTGDPAAAPEAEQDQRAFLLFKMRGYQPWECADSRHLGLI
jgi:transglycosylase-like protein/putative Flp pilus-assembly TadE/G-like protein